MASQTRKKQRPNWVVKLVIDGPLKRGIGEIPLQYGQDQVPIRATGLFAKAEPHKGSPRVLVSSVDGGFGKTLPISVRLYMKPGDAIGDQTKGFYFYPGMLFEMEGQNFFRLEHPSE